MSCQCGSLGCNRQGEGHTGYYENQKYFSKLNKNKSRFAEQLAQHQKEHRMAIGIGIYDPDWSGCPLDSNLSDKESKEPVSTAKINISIEEYTDLKNKANQADRLKKVESLLEHTQLRLHELCGMLDQAYEKIK